MINAVAWNSPWTFMFIALSVGISFVVLVTLLFPVGLFLFDGAGWVANWSIFGVNAAVSGIIADQILRRQFRVLVLIVRQPRLPMIWMWLGFMLLIGILGPDRLAALVHSLKLHFS
jgi:uncharacterized membrane protein YhfC